ncbi:MAG: YqhG family protein, partial [Anaerobacillus sp.]
DHSWADDAKKRWAADLLLLDQFYQGNTDADTYLVEKEALRKQYEPIIKAEVINGGIFYLAPGIDTLNH